MSSSHPSECMSVEFKSCGDLEKIWIGQHNEKQKLLRNNKHGFKSYKNNSRWFIGAYNKVNFATMCYNYCVTLNGGYNLTKASRLLCFGGDFSRIGATFSCLLLFLLFMMPFVAVLPVLPFFKQLSSLKKRYLLLSSAGVEFLLLLWHLYCLCVIKFRILKKWRNAWFTFSVNADRWQDHRMSSNYHTFFIEGKLRCMDVSVSDLYRLNSGLDEVTPTEREELASVVEQHRLNQAVVLMYSKKFIREFISCSMLQIFALALLSITSLSVLLWRTLVEFAV